MPLMRKKKTIEKRQSSEINCYQDPLPVCETLITTQSLAGSTEPQDLVISIINSYWKKTDHP